MKRVCLLIGMACLSGLVGCDGTDIDAQKSPSFASGSPSIENFCPAILDDLDDLAGFGPVHETWECYDRYERVRTPPLVTLTRLSGESEGYGHVYVGSEAQPAAFGIQGIDRRWDFGCDEEERSYPFAFVIDPDGSGLYYNFRPSKDGTAKPSDLYDCELAS